MTQTLRQITTVGNSLGVTLPREMLGSYGLEKGALVELRPGFGWVRRGTAAGRDPGFPRAIVGGASVGSPAPATGGDRRRRPPAAPPPPEPRSAPGLSR